MSKTMKRPLTGYLSTFGFTIISIFNIIFVICISNPNLPSESYQFLCSLLIGWMEIPCLIIAILDNEISITATLFICFMVLCIVLTYFVLPIIALCKSSKNINGVLIVLLSIDILSSYFIILGDPISGIFNISLKILLIVLCCKNIKWYNENYDIL